MRENYVNKALLDHISSTPSWNLSQTAPFDSENTAEEAPRGPKKQITKSRFLVFHAIGIRLMKNDYFATRWLDIHSSAHSESNGINTEGFCVVIEALLPAGPFLSVRFTDLQQLA